MNGKIDLVIDIPEVLQKPHIVKSELQILKDGILYKSIIVERPRHMVIDMPVQDSTTITVELRGIYESGVMDTPVIHEFVIVDGLPVPRSELLGITIFKIKESDETPPVS